jgi:hypothetical protein
MPPIKGQAKGFNLAKSLQTHAKDETDYGMDFSRLPPGISGGIAHLVEARMGKYKTGKNEGEPHILLRAVVVQPLEHTYVMEGWENGKVVPISKPITERVEGRQTMLTLPLCATSNSRGEPTDGDENVDSALNELRKLGGEECTAGLAEEEDLVGLLEQLQGSDIYFRFSTRAGKPTAEYPTSRTFESWLGTKGLEEKLDELRNGQDPEHAVQDRTGSAPGTEATAEPPAPAEGEEDLDTLAEQAASDEKAGERLMEIAVTAGVDEAAAKQTKTWAEVVDMINKARDVPQQPAAEPAADWEPKVKQVYKYKPLDPKTKKAVKKAVEVEVVAAYKKNRTVDLKNLDNTKITYKGVSWDDLESAED